LYNTPPETFTFSKKEQKMTEITLIKPITIDAAEKARLASIMASANIVTASYMEKIKDSVCFHFSMEKFRSIFIDADPNVDLNVHGIIIPSSDLKKMQSVKAIEQRVLQSVGRQIILLARKAAFSKSTQLEFEDYYNEALMSAINAVYSYTKVDIAFTTFVQRAIKNKFSNINNANRATSPVSQSAKVNYKNYSLIRANNPELSFEEIAEQMDLNEKELFSLRSMFVSVTPVSQIGDEDMDGENILSRIPDNSTKAVVFEKFDEIVNETEMDEWEKTVLNAFLSGKDHGWASEVAAQNINPATNAPYSRRAPRIALDRVLDRIRKQYFSAEELDESFEEAA
jgi:DNA-directed RNA polymerase specialized sigma subunit